MIALALAYALAAAWLWRLARNAPAGWEDDKGWHEGVRKCLTAGPPPAQGGGPEGGA